MTSVQWVEVRDAAGPPIMHSTASHSRELPVPGRQWCPGCQPLGYSWGVWWAGSSQVAWCLPLLENRRTPDALAHSHHPGHVRLFSVVLLEWELLFWWLHTVFILSVFCLYFRFLKHFISLWICPCQPHTTTSPPMYPHLGIFILHKSLDCTTSPTLLFCYSVGFRLHSH